MAFTNSAQAILKYCVQRSRNVTALNATHARMRMRERCAHHDYVLPGDVDLEVGRDPRRTAGLCAGAVGLNVN
jgi:hypothetical protein